MDKDVLISLCGMQRETQILEVQGEEVLEVICPGSYFYKDGLHYVFYEEMDPDNGQVTKNKIVYKENGYLEVVKKGSTNSRMLFEKNVIHRTDYETLFGSVELSVITKDIKYKIEEDRMELRIIYALDIMGEGNTPCEIRIKVVEKRHGI